MMSIVYNKRIEKKSKKGIEKKEREGYDEGEVRDP
jgi:hypothetical protein